MGKRLKNYIKFIEKRIEKPMTDDELENLKNDLLIQISFFQHERLIHLIVTFMFALLSVLTLFTALLIEQFALWALFLLFIVLVIPYVAHYYKLENGVQKLYKFYDKLCGFITIQED